MTLLLSLNLWITNQPLSPGRRLASEHRGSRCWPQFCRMRRRSSSEPWAFRHIPSAASAVSLLAGAIGGRVGGSFCQQTSIPNSALSSSVSTSSFLADWTPPRAQNASSVSVPNVQSQDLQAVAGGRRHFSATTKFCGKQLCFWCCWGHPAELRHAGHGRAAGHYGTSEPGAAHSMATETGPGHDRGGGHAQTQRDD